jgi:membrane fusion protein (multidrug efflux system)
MSLRRVHVIVACLLTAGILSGCGRNDQAQAKATAEAKPARPPEAPEAEAVAVRVRPLELRTMHQIHRASTTLRAARTAPVVARASGILRELRVEEGAFVQNGQVLAVLEDDAARLDAEKARVDLDVAEREFVRSEQLLRESLMSPEQHGQKQAALAQAKAARDRAELALSWTKVTAPLSGVITKRHLDRGATVNSMQAVFELADISRLYADVAIPEGVAVKLKPGGKSTLFPVSSSPVEATIERLAPSVDAASGTVKVTFYTPASRVLKPGAFVEVEVITDTHSAVPAIPRDALIADGAKWRIFEVESGKARAMGVTTGFENDGWVEIAPESAEVVLSPGKQIVVSGAAALTDGAAVQVVSDPN